MKAQGTLVLVAALLMVGAPLAAQQSSTTDSQQAERARRDTDRAMREAERQMHDAQRQMRDAQRTIEEAARRLAELKTGEAMRRLDKRVVVFGGDHARLGIVLDSDPDEETEAIGVLVQGLTPGGPAEEAGVQAGDIIIKLNGEALVTAHDKGEEPSSAGERLFDLVSSLKDGDKVQLELRHGKDTRSVTVTARNLGGPRIQIFSHSDGGFEPFEVATPEIDLDVAAFVKPWRDLELVSIGPDLGEYFGANEGLLVVRSPAGSALNLHAGDVILRIGSRAPSSPAQALRILRSYEPGERVPVEVVRKREKLTVEALIPEGGRTRLMTPPAAPAPPVAPVAPAAPSPPLPPTPRASRSSRI